jgi:hypothetical protein
MAFFSSKELHLEARPRIISDNGPRFIAKDFKECIRIPGMTYVRTSPYRTSYRCSDDMTDPRLQTAPDASVYAALRQGVTSAKERRDESRRRRHGCPRHVLPSCKPGCTQLSHRRFPLVQPTDRG